MKTGEIIVTTNTIYETLILNAFSPWQVVYGKASVSTFDGQQQ